MTEPRAQHTLVKSPPELWAEISDVEALTRHLGELGPIRITRKDPETTVAWEGDRVRGTVQLEASGWGTKVTLTAQPDAVEEVPPPVAAPARAAAPLPATARRPGLLGLFRRRPRAGGSAPPGLQSRERGQTPPTEPAGHSGAPGLEAHQRGQTPLMREAEVEAVLVCVLDELGSATKRPFSR